MKTLRGIKLWLGSYGWGWNLFGVSYKDKWFFGFSRKSKSFSDQMK